MHSHQRIQPFKKPPPVRAAFSVSFSAAGGYLISFGLTGQLLTFIVKENFNNVNNYQLKISNYFSAGSFGSTQTVRLFVKITMPGFAPFGFFT